MVDLRAGLVFEDALGDGDRDMVCRLLDLGQEPSPALMARVRAIPARSQNVGKHILRWAWSLAALAILAIVLVSISPPLRAAMARLQVTIGRVYLSVTDNSPGGDATIVEPELMSLQAARAAVPFNFGMPTHIPDGWQMAEPVRLNDLGNGPYVVVNWTRSGYGNIILFVRAAPPVDGAPGGWLVGEGSFKEIQINGQPAVLIRGGWDANTHEWAWPEITTIVWTTGDAEYRLEAGADVADADLIGMAESVQ